VAVRSGWQRRELQPELHREVQPPYQQVGSSLVHVHAPEQCRGGRVGTPQLPAPVLAHPVGVFDEPLTKNQDLPYLKGTGVPGRGLGQRGPPRGAAGLCRRRAKVPAAASSPGTPVKPRSHPHSWCTHRISATAAVRNVLPGRAPSFPRASRGDALCSVQTHLTAHPKGVYFLSGGETLNHRCFLGSRDAAGATRASAASLGAPRSPVGWQRWAALLPRARLNVQPLL